MERTKILITGATGTIGKILAMHLSPWYDVYAPSRQELNLLDRLSVVDYLLEHNWFDVIIHCAVKGANDVRSTDSSIALDNIRMYYNLADCINNYGKFINIGSGCEYAQDVPDNISDQILVEELVTGYVPELPYAFSKNVIARSILQHRNRYNLRLWGIMAQTRIFNNLWSAVVANQPEFVIAEDRYMDYITEDDLVKIVRYYVDTENPTVTDLNMVYDTKYKVSEVVERYIEDNGLEIKVKVTGQSKFNYYGSGAKLKRLGIL